MTTITLGGITFGGQDAIAGWGFSDLTGWYESTGSKSSISDRQQADGSFQIGRSYRKSAVPSFKAFYVDTDPGRVLDAAARVAALGGDGAPQTMVVMDERGAFSRIVSVRAADVTKFTGGLDIAWGIDTFAADPLRYADAVVTTTGVPVSAGGLVWPLGSGSGYIDFGAASASGRATASNPGTAATLPLLEVTGGMSLGFVIADVMSGNYDRIDRVVPLGSTVFINQRTGRVTIDGPGNDIGQYVTRRDLLPVPAGGTRQFQLSPLGVVTGTPTLTVRTSPAFY